MANFWVRPLGGTSPSAKNVHLQVSGFVEAGGMVDWRELVNAADFHTRSLRLDAVNYALSEKTEVLLAWDKAKGDKEPHVFLPLNGRGRLDFDSINGLQNTVGEGKSGNILIYVSTELPRPRRAYFSLTLDFSKQGN